MKSYITLFLSLILISCQNVKKNDISNTSNQFFDFDEIIHYHKEISEKEWLKIVRKEPKNDDEIIFLRILNENYPTTTKDKNFINALDKLYPSKIKIEKNKFKEIGNIFSEKYHGEYAVAGCEPFYRDVLVFKKNNEVVGISKICFQCALHSTIGTKKNTDQLGQNGDYAKLKILLEK